MAHSVIIIDAENSVYYRKELPYTHVDGIGLFVVQASGQDLQNMELDLTNGMVEGDVMPTQLEADVNSLFGIEA